MLLHKAFINAMQALLPPPLSCSFRGRPASKQPQQPLFFLCTQRNFEFSNYKLSKLQSFKITDCTFFKFFKFQKNRKNIQPKLFATNGWIFAFEYLALVNAVLLRILQRLEALKTRENRHQKKFEIILSFGLSLLGILYPPERSLF